MTKPVYTKQTFLALGAFTSVICSILMCCNNQAPVNENVQTITNDTIKKADTTSTTYLNDVKTYREKMADTMSIIDKRITEYKAKLDSGGREVKAEYKKEIADLDQKGKELKKKLDSFQAKGKKDWDKFKVDFTQDVDTLSKQIKQLTASKK